MNILYPFKSIGHNSHVFIRELGRMGIFIATSFIYALQPPYLINRVIKQIFFIGVKTLVVIILTGLFTGMVLTLQVYYVLVTLGAESKLGSITAISLIRELGPVISGLMVIGRAGSALTAELGIMRITEQTDALDAMGLNPYKYLIVPNFIASIICLPLLNAIFVIVGIWGGYLVGVELSGLSSGVYYGGIADSVLMKDITLNFYKSISFGILIAWICCYKGFFVGVSSNFGAQGVSKATTEAVVLSSVIILICDYFITSIMIFV